MNKKHEVEAGAPYTPQQKFRALYAELVYLDAGAVEAAVVDMVPSVLMLSEATEEFLP